MSGLEKQLAGVDFTQGLETRQDKRLVIPGKLLSASNCTLSATNAITRRDGGAVSNNTQLAAANGLALLGNELLVVNGGTLYTLAAGNSTLYSRGHVSPLTLRKEEVRRAVGYQTEADCATSSTFTCYVWRDYAANQTTVNGIYCTVKDEATGAVILNGTQLSSSATAYCPRVIYSSASVGFVVTWADAANVKALFIPSSTFVPSATTNIATNNNAGTPIDVISAQGTAFILYGSTDATNSVFTVATLFLGGVFVTGPPVAVATQAVIPVGVVSGLSLANFTSTVLYGTYVLAVAGGAYTGVWGAVTDGAVLTSALAKLDAVAAPGAGLSRITATAVGANMTVYSDDAADWGGGGGAGAQVPIRTVTVNSTHVVQSGPATLIQSNTQGFAAPNGPFIAGKAFTVSGVAYLPVHLGGVTAAGFNLQCMWALLDSSGNVVAKALYGNYGLWSINANPPSSSTPPSTPALSSGVVVVPVGEKGVLSFASSVLGALTNVTPVGLSRLLLTWYGSTPPLSATLGPNTFFAGGLLSAYDGQLAAEAGFTTFPEGVRVAQGAAGGVVDIGVHLYVALYEWVDAQGQRHQSAPSPAVSYTAADSTHRATVTIPTLLLTAKSNVNIAVFRTIAAGGTFFRLNAQTAPVANSTSASSVTYTDNTSDANLVSGELLYTTGGALQNNGPPSCSVLAVHQNRVFLGGLEDPNELRYSQAGVQGVGLQWNETLNGRVDPTGGGLTALCAMDEKLALFCARKPFQLLGTGPNGLGAQNGYLIAEVVADVGCSEPRSVLKMPMGLLFKAPKGWHLLDRGMQVRYVGSGVEAFNANSVCAAVLMDDRKECRFYSLTGTTLVYSYLVDQWATSAGVAAAAALWWPAGGYVVWASAAGAINHDTPGAYSDFGSPITVTVDTGWLKPGASLHGFERVYDLLLAGPYGGAGALTVTAYFDFDETVVATLSVPDTSVLASTASTAWNLRWHLAKKCQAVRFRIAETPSSTTFGLGLSGMSLLVGIKRGAIKLPQTKSF